jgi:predicted aldo/keto reductase-like oxidoreductase
MVGEAKSGQEPLPRITLGNTGLQVSRLGLGGYHQVEISSEIVEQVVTAYLEAGGNYIETARVYGAGASEEKIGRALSGKRDKVVLVSKSIARDAAGIRMDLEASLGALQTERIDFYYFHCVDTIDELDTITGPDGALSALLKAKEEGLIGGIGFSSHRPPDLYREAIKRLPLSVILIWNNYLDDLYLPEIQREIYPLAREYGVGVTAMKPLADGFLHRSVDDALRYALGSGPEVLICGMNSPAHVHEAAKAVLRGPARKEEREAILRDAPELGRYVCRQCGACSDDLMRLFRLEGYIDRQMIDYLPHDPADYALRRRLSRWFTLADMARQRFSEEDFRIDDLLAEAERVDCPFNIDVPRKLKLTLAKLREENIDLV